MQPVLAWWIDGAHAEHPTRHDGTTGWAPTDGGRRSTSLVPAQEFSGDRWLNGSVMHSGESGAPRAMADRIAAARSEPHPDSEGAILRRYGFAIPTDDALDEIAERSPGGVVELGAGVGYWAHQLSERGVDVVAYDIEPPPSPRNHRFAGSTPWHPIARGDERAVVDHADRSLLLIWPTKNETWATEALIGYHAAGGACVLYVGDGPGGRTGDPTFHATLGELGPCLPCTLGVPDAPCTCTAQQLWQRENEVGLPAWQADDVRLFVYARAVPETLSVRRRIARRGRRLFG